METHYRNGHVRYPIPPKLVDDPTPVYKLSSDDPRLFKLRQMVYHQLQAAHDAAISADRTADERTIQLGRYTAFRQIASHLETLFSDGIPPPVITLEVPSDGQV